MDLEQQLRETYVDRLGSLDPSGGDVGAARRAGARSRSRRRIAAGVAATAVVAVAAGGALLGTGRMSDGPSHDTGHWRELPAPPLSPRAGALAVWTGREAIVLGGQKHPCPPNASCVGDPPALRDGAAYDPATGTWHRIAEAPVQVQSGDQAVSAAGRVILQHWKPHGSRTFVYDPVADDWTQIPTFTGPPSAVGDDVYGFRRGRVVTYDARRGLWNERIPRDPIRPRLRQAVLTATASGPVVTGVPANVATDGSVAPLVAADVYDGSRWRRLPATGQVGNNAWFWTGTRMVDAEPGTEDGGQVDGWGRSYPAGGILDPATGRWSRLPAAFGDGTGWGVYASGGAWVATYGQVYDTETGQVATLPRPDGASDEGVAAAWAGDRLLAFGGATFGAAGPTLTDRAWLWTP